MPSLRVSALYRYPVKSLAGEAFSSLEVGARGPELDRHWMVVDADGRFITQRQQPRMCLVQARIDHDQALWLAAPGMPEIRVGERLAERLEVRVWDDLLPASAAGPAADRWLSEFLSLPCRLVSMPDDVARPVDPDYADPADQVGFADGFPFLLISQASLDDLNSRLESPLPMLRFRPNLVVSGCDPYAEDSWRRLRIGDLEFQIAKPCSRCIIPTIDPTTAQRSAEPLHTLKGYRRRDNKIYFGQNLVHRGSGRLAVGMPVEVLA